jgi:CRP-like cAMP-binding protein
MDGPVFLQIQNALENAGFLSYLAPGEIDALVSKLRMRHFTKGETVIRQGERGDAFYILAEGRAEVFVEKPKKKKVAELGAGDFFGEISLLTNEPRSATVSVKDGSLLFILDGKDFANILLTNRETLKLLVHTAVERKQRAEQGRGGRGKGKK